MSLVSTQLCRSDSVWFEGTLELGVYMLKVNRTKGDQMFQNIEAAIETTDTVNSYRAEVRLDKSTEFTVSLPRLSLCMSVCLYVYKGGGEKKAYRFGTLDYKTVGRGWLRSGRSGRERLQIYNFIIILYFIAIIAFANTL